MAGTVRGPGSALDPSAAGAGLGPRQQCWWGAPPGPPPALGTPILLAGLGCRAGAARALVTQSSIAQLIRASPLVVAFL